MSESPEVQWGAFASLPRFSAVSGIAMQLMAGENIGLNLVTLAAAAVVADHAHSNEQAGYVVSGLINMTIAGETRALVPGDGYLIPADVPHGATAGPQGCVVIDIFSPPRADYVELARKAAAESNT